MASFGIKKYWYIIRDSLLGKEQDYTVGSIDKAIVLLAIPMILEMLMESIFAIVDIFFVGKLGNSAVATVGMTESMLTIVYSVAIGISMAATAMVARRIGEKDKEGASRSASQAIMLGGGISVLISLIGILFADDLLTLIGASAETIEHGTGYTRWMLGGNIVIMMLFLNNAIFRGAGDAFLALRVLALSNLLNIILDPILIFGLGPIPAYGLEGAAYATNIGRFLGMIYQFYYLFNGRSVIKLRLADFKIVPKLIKRLIDVASGGTGQFIIASSSWIFLYTIINEFGDEAAAGYTIAIRVLIFTIMPAWGIANAAATLVGQNLGASQPERAEKSVWRTGMFDMIFLGFVSVVYILFAEEVIGIFTTDTLVLKHGIQALQWISLGYVFFAWEMVIAQSFNGAGDTRTPTILNFFGFWVLQIPLAYVTAIVLGMGPLGVYISIAISESLLAVAAVIMFRRGKWKSVKI